MGTEILPDAADLRAGRRARLLAGMEAHNLDVLILGRVANIRYASGVPILWNAGTRPFGPGCVVVRDTEEIYLLSTWDEGVPEDLPHDHLFGITWNPMNYVAVLKRIAAEARPRRVGTDAMSPLFAQLLPMAFPESDIVDGSAALRSAKRTKTPQEVEAIRAAVEVADAALAAAVAALRPGVTERELTGVFMDAMASQGVTTPATQDVARVTTGGGARRGGGGRPVQERDLVAFRAGVVANGYGGEVGRTWYVGSDGCPAAVIDLHRRSEALSARLIDACRPGASASALLDAYRAAGEPLPPTPVGRGLGLGFDDPVVAGALPATAAKERLDAGVVLVVTACVGDEASGSLITHQPVLVTDDGPNVLTQSPFWAPERTGAHP